MLNDGRLRPSKKRCNHTLTKAGSEGEEIQVIGKLELQDIWLLISSNHLEGVAGAHAQDRG